MRNGNLTNKNLEKRLKLYAFLTRFFCILNGIFVVFVVIITTTSSYGREYLQTALFFFMGLLILTVIFYKKMGNINDKLRVLKFLKNNQ